MAKPSASTDATTSSTPPQTQTATVEFDEVQAELYSKFAEQCHRHPDGPWACVAEVVYESLGMKKASRGNAKALDLASGMGEPGATIAGDMPNVRVVSTDLSPAMHERARQVAADIPNMEAKVADMQNLRGYRDKSYDVVTCSFGYMLAPNLEKSLSETLRVLKDGGTLVATTWDECPLIELSRSILEYVVGEHRDPPPLSEMSLSEPWLFDSMVQDAGFANVRTTLSIYPFDLTDDEEFQFQMATLDIRDQLDEIGDEGWEKARAGFKELAPKYTTVDDDGHMIIEDNVFKMLVATKPSLRVGWGDIDIGPGFVKFRLPGLKKGYSIDHHHHDHKLKP